MRNFLITALLSLFSITAFSQQKYQSLLWEISGNGLEKPSYLYGTMHVSKKVAFRLDDVFYEALNKSECVALESDPTTWPEFNYNLMISDYGQYSYGNNRGFYKNLFKLTHPDIMSIRSSIRMDNGVINGYLYRKNNASDNFEEETYLDMFIYQAGKKNNKEIVGLEDLEESRYLVTKAQYNPEKKDIDPWLQKLFSKESPYVLQENLYRERNLDLLDSIGAGLNTEFYRQNMLFKRNENMVIALDKLIREKTVFAGVGAAHLPGEQGMINMLRLRGYTVKALTSKQTTYSKTEKTKLDSLFLQPTLSPNSTPDGFITLNTYDKLREFSYNAHKYYLDPDMTNGAYLTVSRISRYLYLPNEKDNITLEDIDNLLYEDIPGDIIKKEAIEAPYPGISIVNKTKKGEFQKYHIYETPLEIIILKFAGKSDFVLKHQNRIFDSIKIKPISNSIEAYRSPKKKFEVQFPSYYTSSNIDHPGSKMIEGYNNGDYYFLLESPNNDISYIEEDSFEAKYLHHAFYKIYKLSESKGQFKRGDYKTYESEAIIDSTSNETIFLKTVVKDGSYYLLGYKGANSNDEVRSYFDSFKVNTVDYSGFKKVKDTSLHFSAYTTTKQPTPNYYGYNRNSEKKDYEETTKKTVYSSKANEQIFITRTKYHDLQMFHNIDSLWYDLERKVNIKNRYSSIRRSYKVSNKVKSSDNNIHTFSFEYWDPKSAKRVLVKNVLKDGVLFELKALTDSIAEPSKYITEFYDSFTPSDTLLGKSVLEDKTQLFFNALKENDSISFESYDLIKFKKQHIKDIIQIVKEHDFDKERLDIKSHLTKEIITLDLKNNMAFLKTLYKDSYSDPKTQIAILDGLLEANTKSSYALFLELMAEDLPLSSNKINSVFYSYPKKDSLDLKRTLYPNLLKYTSIDEYKQPIYGLLSKLKDSALIKPKSYSKFKEQLINDGKIQIKRSLSNTSRYRSYSRNLKTYVNLIFPYRKEKSGKDFFERLLNSEDKNALVRYHVLLVKAGEDVPSALKEKTIDNEENQYLLLEEFDRYKLLHKIDTKVLNQKQYVKSRLKAFARYDEDKDSLNFSMTREFKTDKGKDAIMYFFKIEKNGNYRNSDFIHAMAFLKPENDNDVVVDYYYKTSNSGVKIDETKPIEEQYAELLDLATYKDRERLSGRNSNY